MTMPQPNANAGVMSTERYAKTATMEWCCMEV